MAAPGYKYSEFPTFMWHPETGERKLCKSSEDVPEGYLDHHPEDPARIPPKPEKPADEVDGMPREEIVAALKAGNVKFTPNTGTPKLSKILSAEVDAALTAAGIDVNTDAGLKERYTTLIDSLATSKE